MSKGEARPPQRDFADILDATLARWYETEAEFAELAGISAASVSRWRRRIGRPGVAMLEKMQPYMKDQRGRPWSLPSLIEVTYPGDVRQVTGTTFAGGNASGTTGRALSSKPDHPLVTELARMLGEDSPLPADKRENLITLLEAVVAPYRTFTRRRKTG